MQNSPNLIHEKRKLYRTSLHLDVAELLRDMIVRGDLPEGERIDEKALCSEFEISRTPLREALKVIAAEGLVDLLPSRGTQVSRLTAVGVDNLFELIAGIERLAVELAATRGSDEDIARLRKLHDQMAVFYNDKKRGDYFRLNHQIHQRIVSMAGNTLLEQTHADLMIKAQRARFAAITSQERWDESMVEHTELIKAIEQRDGALAGKILFNHVRKTGVAVRAVIEKKSEILASAR